MSDLDGHSLRDAILILRADLDESYPNRAPYDIPSTVIDRLDRALMRSEE